MYVCVCVCVCIYIYIHMYTMETNKMGEGGGKSSKNHL